MQIKLTKQILNLFFITSLITTFGCKSNTYEIAFKEAESNIKYLAQNAQALDTENQYMAAAEAYDKILHENITKKQEKIVQEKIWDMYKRLKKQAQNGDPLAKKLLTTLETNLKLSEYN